MFSIVASYARQIIPPVIATLVAALLIAGFNRAFSTHFSQPRMAAVNGLTNAEPPGARLAPTAKPAEPVLEFTPALVARPEKNPEREAAKEQPSTKVAEVTPAQPVEPARTEPARTEPARAEPVRRSEPRRAEPQPAPVYAAPVHTPTPYIQPAPQTPVVVMAPPVQAQPMPAQPMQVQPMHGHPVIVAPAVAPPPVIMAQPVRQGEPAVVNVPDRPRAMPQPQYEPAQQTSQGPIGTIVNNLKPSTWFDRAREFGERIEAAGNDILPNIRQQ